MFTPDSEIWYTLYSDGSVAIYVEQWGRVYMIGFSSLEALKMFLSAGLDFVSKAKQPSVLSPNIVEWINRIP